MSPTPSILTAWCLGWAATTVLWWWRERTFARLERRRASGRRMVDWNWIVGLAVTWPMMAYVLIGEAWALHKYLRVRPSTRRRRPARSGALPAPPPAAGPGGAGGSAGRSVDVRGGQPMSERFLILPSFADRFASRTT